jgi:hypothetical protein
MLRAIKTHYLLWLLAALVSLNSACSSCGKNEAVTGENPAAPTLPMSSVLPFSTKEPATYQAEIVISFPGAAGAPGTDAGTDAAETEAGQKYFIARDGEKRRIDYEFSAKETMSVLEDAGGRTIVLPVQKKCSAEEKTGAGNISAPQGEPFSEFLTNGWLAEKIPANFEELSGENIGGKPLRKFRVRYEKTNGTGSISEAIVWVDEELGMPVKTEFYSLKDGQKMNPVTTEFRNIKLSVAPDIFAKPERCQNITPKEMQKILWQERLNAE